MSARRADMKAKAEKRKAGGSGRKAPLASPGERPPVTAYIALGSNLGEPVGQIRRALRALADLPRTRLVRHSSFYRNPPAGGLDQPEFVNAVAEIETRIEPRDLLDRLLDIERTQGRVRDFPSAPRTLDLDILLYGGRRIAEPGLTVPHPRMLERAFVMIPLAEIAPAARVPGSGRVADLARHANASGMLRMKRTAGFISA
jgi:2-amino-4-hydroxy-6-hydroxymethyldihydropteridine diphosphokinase